MGNVTIVRIDGYISQDSRTPLLTTTEEVQRVQWQGTVLYRHALVKGPHPGRFVDHLKKEKNRKIDIGKGTKGKEKKGMKSRL